MSSGKDWREVGLTRLLSANALIRFNHGLIPFFGSRTPQYVSVLHDATVVDPAGWHNLVFLRSWMVDRAGGVSRHAMVALRDKTTGRVALVDSNGSSGTSRDLGGLYTFGFSTEQHARVMRKIVEHVRLAASFSLGIQIDRGPLQKLGQS